MTDDLQLHSDRRGDRHTVVASGEIDMDSSPRLLAEIQRALRGGGHVDVELSGIRYIDSSGIAVLVQGLKAAQKNRQEFALRRPSERVLAVLELADLKNLFRIETGDATP